MSLRECLIGSKDGIVPGERIAGDKGQETCGRTTEHPIALNTMTASEIVDISLRVSNAHMTDIGEDPSMWRAF